jgi:hypothetical protein
MPSKFFVCLFDDPKGMTATAQFFHGDGSGWVWLRHWSTESTPLCGSDRQPTNSHNLSQQPGQQSQQAMMIIQIDAITPRQSKKDRRDGKISANYQSLCDIQGVLG